jgi:ribose 5-phosphate isomerase B
MTNSATKKVFIASDHAGFFLKMFLFEELVKLDFEVIDLGCDSAERSVDYPDFVEKLVSNINDNPDDFGILICGSGIGMSIAANRFKHVRAALCHNSKSAKLARAHNNANVLCLGARTVKKEVALATVRVFFSTKFEGGRHVERVKKMS